MYEDLSLRMKMIINNGNSYTQRIKKHVTLVDVNSNRKFTIYHATIRMREKKKAISYLRLGDF